MNGQLNQNNPMLLLYKNFLSNQECEQLNTWVDFGVKNKWLDRGFDKDSFCNSNFRVTTRMYADRFNYPKIVYDVFERISSKLQIEDLEKSVAGGGKDGVVVSCTFDGADIYKHVDPKEGNLEVLRCNILTRKSDSGGDLYINDSKVKIEVGDLHCYLPSTVEHHVSTVHGKTPRILWMFGYQCSIDRFNHLCKLNAK